jgi:hypothetical protein
MLLKFLLLTYNGRIVAWAALPMCTPQFSIVEGKYKVPMLRGEHSPSVQHYKTIEDIMGNDLNAWLCNIYVEVKHLPKIFVDDNGNALVCFKSLS